MHARTHSFFFQKPLLLPAIVTEAMRIRGTRIKRLAVSMNWISYIMTEKLPVQTNCGNQGPSIERIRNLVAIWTYSQWLFCQTKADGKQCTLASSKEIG